VFSNVYLLIDNIKSKWDKYIFLLMMAYHAAVHDEYIFLLMMAYRAAVHETTKVPPL
jgi:hypothetical protein